LACRKAGSPNMSDDQPSDDASFATTKPKPTKSATARKKGARKKGAAKKGDAKKRTQRPYPAVPFEEALPLAEAIQRFASGERVRRLTLLGKLQKNPNSGGTRMLITNAGRYGLTTGSYAAEWLALTDLGKVVTSPDTPTRDKRAAEFTLAIENIEPFKFLYEQYKTKRLPSHEVMKDALRESGQQIPDPQECIDIFIVDAKYLGLLSTIAGAETLLPIDHVLDEAPVARDTTPTTEQKRSAALGDVPVPQTGSGKVAWSKICFYIAPIGDEGTELRKHSDMFLGSLLEPALKDFDLEVVRADKIGEPGMIPGQVIEHIMRAKLVVVDMSYHNPNVFYEMALRHACRLPIVQISRKADRLPFDVNQMRTVVIDTTDIYALVPKLETYRSEIATQVRGALAEGDAVMTPISVFFPGFLVTVPKQK
jgi:hypothetical protein